MSQNIFDMRRIKKNRCIYKGSKLLQAMRNSLNSQIVKEHKEVKKDEKPLTLTQKLLTKSNNESLLAKNIREVIQKEKETNEGGSALLKKLIAASGNKI